MHVNITTKCYQPSRVKNLRRNRLLVRTISPQIKSFRRRIGKNTVISVVEIREFDPCPGLDRQEWRNKSEIFLSDLLVRRRRRFREGTFKVNYGQRLLGREIA